MQLNRREEFNLEEAKTFLQSALKQLEHFERSRAVSQLGTLYTAREQAWQAARGISQLAGLIEGRVAAEKR